MWMRINLAFIVPGRWLVCDLEDTQGVTCSLQSPKPRPPQDRQGDPGWSRDEWYLCGPLQWCGGECFHSSVSPHCSRWCHFGLPVCHSCLYYNWRASAFEKYQLHSLLRTWTCGQHLTCFGWSYCKHSYKVFFLPPSVGVSLLCRRTLSSTTRGVLLALMISAHENCGWTWVTFGAPTSESIAFCQIHTSRLWWVWLICGYLFRFANFIDFTYGLHSKTDLSWIDICKINE